MPVETVCYCITMMTGLSWTQSLMYLSDRVYWLGMERLGPSLGVFPVAPESSKSLLAVLEGCGLLANG